MSVELATTDRIQFRAWVNEWISSNLPEHRKYVRHSEPEYMEHRKQWRVALNSNTCGENIGYLFLDADTGIVKAESATKIARKIDSLLDQQEYKEMLPPVIEGNCYKFSLADGVLTAENFEDRELDLLLTDPPYGISKSYICEKQIPRRLRKNGRDFIMPKGHFGDWDNVPEDWLDIVLPKVGGWAVSFCAHSQIGEYQEALNRHKFVAVGAMVWKKTNPVPFNHKFKPINSWEAIVIGKRPSTKFNGHVVHNVFQCKSPSPQTRIHPTQKPLSLLEDFVELFSSPGDLVFDPFGGGATALIAAAKKGRRAISCELNPAIYQAAGKRIVVALA